MRAQRASGRAGRAIERDERSARAAYLASYAVSILLAGGPHTLPPYMPGAASRALASLGLLTPGVNDATNSAKWTAVTVATNLMLSNSNSSVFSDRVMLAHNRGSPSLYEWADGRAGRYEYLDWTH